MAKGSIDYAQLSLYLRVLGVPNRLELLRKLQVPRAATEIELTAHRRDENRPGRFISRQAVDGHLTQLEALGLLVARRAKREGRQVTEYVLDHGRLFTVADELRRIGLLRPSVSLATATPGTSSATTSLDLPTGPALVLANGPMEGSVFALDGSGPWTVGRERPATILLAHDPFVSKLNSTLERRGDGFVISNQSAARNGTRVNWRTLETNERAELVSGDAIGVGRSLLFARGL